MATLAVRIGEDLGVEVKLDERMAAHTSMRVGGRVAAYLRPSGATETAAAVRGLRDAGVPHRILGGGTNLLAADEDLDFVVVQGGAPSSGTDWDGPVVRAPAGLSLGVLVRVRLCVWPPRGAESVLSPSPRLQICSRWTR